MPIRLATTAGLAVTRLYLVRHATHGLVDKALAGRLPGVTLSEEGARQADAVAGYFGARTVGAILSSPLERCRETADRIAARTGVPIMIDHALTELDCGEWTGRTFEDLHADPRWQAWNNERGQTVVPGGESIDAVRHRVMAVVERLGAIPHPPTVVVTHSDVIKVAILALLGASLDLHDRLEIGPASITTLDLWPGGGKIVRSNEAAA